MPPIQFNFKSLKLGLVILQQVKLLESQLQNLIIKKKGLFVVKHLKNQRNGCGSYRKKKPQGNMVQLYCKKNYCELHVHLYMFGI